MGDAMEGSMHAGRDYRVGQTVRLNVPENPRLHDTKAMIDRLAEWGAHVLAPAAAFGHFRAGWGEMVPDDPGMERQLERARERARMGQDNPGGLGSQSVSAEVTAGPPDLKVRPARVGVVRPAPARPRPETTGEVCGQCGGLMVRTGTCLTCQSCGTSSGGCS